MGGSAGGNVWCAQPYLCWGMHQLKRMSEILWGFEMLLKGCQSLLRALGTGNSALYQAFLSTSDSHSPTAKVSAAGFDAEPSRDLQQRQGHPLWSLLQQLCRRSPQLPVLCQLQDSLQFSL